jgi:hypothetical protein
MAVRYDYEWVVEEIDRETGDIIECLFWDDLADALRCHAELANEGKALDFGLCRHAAQTFADGGEPEEIGRDYSYTYGGDALNPDWDEGGPVPQKFAKLRGLPKSFGFVEEDA